MTVKKLVLLLALSPLAAQAGISSFVDQAVLVQHLDENGVVQGQSLDALVLDEDSGSYISRSPSLTLFKAFGICVNLDGSNCQRDLTSKIEMNKAFSLSNGRKQMPAGEMPPFQDFTISSNTRIVKESRNSIILSVEQSIFGGLSRSASVIKISKVQKLSEKKHSFKTPTEDVPDRKFVADVGVDLKALSLGVVQLKTRPDADSLISSGSTNTGTGYFLSADGLMMTNHHVIDSHKGCMDRLSCEIDFSQVLPDGTRRVFTAKATMLAMSELHDFALLKIDLPAELKFSFFKIDNDKVGPDLVTLGYPGDMREGNETKLTYSMGSLVGFHSQAYATSNYIYQGASGSPILNADTLRVVGILSNGAGNPIPGIGSPGIARPIHMIDAEFGLSDYISGAKMIRVRNLLSLLQSTSDVSKAKALLGALKSERTFMGLTTLKKMMVQHQSSEVREEILTSIEEMKFMVASPVEAKDLLKTGIAPKGQIK